MPENANNEKLRKVYEKPEVVSEKIFEATALACAKCANANQVSIGAGCVQQSKGRS